MSCFRRSYLSRLCGWFSMGYFYPSLNGRISRQYEGRLFQVKTHHYLMVNPATIV